MSYIIPRDYNRLIQSDNLSQVINNDQSILSAVQLTAQAEAISYLVQKYIVTEEFTDTAVWSPTTIYKAKNRVYLTAVSYNPLLTYHINDVVANSGDIYVANGTTTGAWTPSRWDYVGPLNAIYFVTLPKPEFNYNNNYAKGDQVWYKDKVYTCQIATQPIGHEAELNSKTIRNIPLKNVFPDDLANGVKYWGAGTAYSVPAKSLVTDPGKYTYGDNRNQQMVSYVIDLCLYHVHSRISPRNIPDLRVKRYDDAIAWLKMAGRGEITAALPLIQPAEGQRITYGGVTKSINTY